MPIIQFDSYLLFLLVFTRMTGALLFHPLLGRRNVPTIVKIGLALLTALVVTPMLPVRVPEFGSTLSFMLCLMKEMLIGYTIGFITNLFVSWVLTAGEIMDMQMGLGMSKLYDPQSNVSMPISGTLFNIMITLIFFTSNGHLTLIRIVSESCRLFPPGPGLVDFQAGSTIGLLLGDLILLALKLAMPVFAIELLSEAGLGVLMRLVPQINVFVVGLQIKLVVGIAIIILALPAISRLMDSSLVMLYEKLQESMELMLPSA